MDNRDARLLEQFFDRTISPEAMAELDRRLAADPDFAAQFEWQKRVSKAFRVADAKAMKARLQQEEQKFNPALKVSWVNSGRLMAIAACLVAVVAAFWFLRPAPVDTAQVFAANYSDFGNNFKNEGSRGTDANEQELFEADMADALQLYDNQDFSGAAGSLSKIRSAKSEQNQGAVSFYTGLCHLKLNNLAEAEKSLKNASEKQGQFQAAALRYLGLTKLAQGDAKAAETVLKKLEKFPPNNPERQKGEKMLKDL